MSTFQQVTAPKYPTPCEVESYRDTANRVGRAEAIAHLVADRPGSAYRRIVETCEDEAKILGLAGVAIPEVHRGMRRLVEARNARRGWV